MGTAEEDWAFRAALSALSNERGKPAYHGAPWYLCHNAEDVHGSCMEEPITTNVFPSTRGPPKVVKGTAIDESWSQVVWDNSAKWQLCMTAFDSGDVG